MKFRKLNPSLAIGKSASRSGRRSIARYWLDQASVDFSESTESLKWLVDDQSKRLRSSLFVIPAGLKIPAEIDMAAD